MGRAIQGHRAPRNKSRSRTVAAIFAAALATFPAVHASADWNLGTVASFNGSNGGCPQTGVVLDSAGDVFGSTFYLGTNGSSTFEIQSGTNTITSLNITNDGSNSACMLIDNSGNLYGGGNNIFEIPAGYTTANVLATFTSPAQYVCESRFVADQAGDLFEGVWTIAGNGLGAVVELPAGANTVTTLATFNGVNGADPLGDRTLVVDGSGNVYGIGNHGGIAYNPNYIRSGNGVIFKIAPGSQTITDLFQFNGTNGADPESLVADQAGNLFGVTEAGGNLGNGTIFEFPKGSNSIITLATFNGTNGNEPMGLIMDAAGDIFGTTFDGGQDNDGVIFELPAGSSTILTLATFNGANGANPESGLIFVPDGNLYGTTVYGGQYDDGAVFELSQSVPEPASLGLLPAATTGLLLRRRRGRMSAPAHAALIAESAAPSTN